MWRFLAYHYRLNLAAVVGQLAPAFTYRRSQLVRPQKWGKGPFSAALICAEAVGPVLFDGWDEDGEPLGRPWATPLIQIAANSEDQTANVYAALQPMIELGPLADLIPDTGDTRINLPGGGRIDPVTSRARTRLGQRVTFVVQDETGLWTEQSGMVQVAETQRRGLAGMGGRSVETTNAWDPSEDSVAQRTAEAVVKDIYRDHRLADPHLKYALKRDRRKVHRSVYGDSAGRGGWVDLDAIEAEAAELMEKDPAQAERFFGNGSRPTGRGSSGPSGTHRGPHRASDRQGPASRSASTAPNWTTGRDQGRDPGRLPVHPTVRSGPAADDLEPRPTGAARSRGSRSPPPWTSSCGTYDVVRLYFDPPYWETEVDTWVDRYGEKVIRWYTPRSRRCTPRPSAGHRRHQGRGDVPARRLPELTAVHVGNARKAARPGGRYVLAQGRAPPEDRPGHVLDPRPRGRLRRDRRRSGPSRRSATPTPPEEGHPCRCPRSGAMKAADSCTPS
jgi:hypothetical protein